jgi:hypothetical protein
MQAVVRPSAWLLALSLVAGFAGPVYADGPDPDQAHKVFGSAFVVFHGKVQDELKLSDDQKEQLKKHRDTLPDPMEFMQKLQGLKPEDRQKEMMSHHEKLAKLLQKTLKPDQAKRLQQIEFQLQGAPYAIGNPKIAEELKITDDQKKKYMTVMQGMQEKMQALAKEIENGGNPQEIHPKMQELHKDQQAKAEAILTDAQKKQWKEMLGKPFNLGD